MRTWIHLILLFACVVLAGLALTINVPSITTHAQQQRPSDPQTQDKVVISKDEVLFDVVVRDKKGRVVRDLTATDFEVFEDGVKQELGSFRFISSGGPVNETSQDNSAPVTTTPESPGAGPKPSDSTDASTISAVALVFDRLSPESRARARDAALGYLSGRAYRNELIGVLQTDLSVVVLQPFTNDSQLVKEGIEKFSVRLPALYTSNNQETREQRDEVVKAAQAVATGQVVPLPGTEFARAAAFELRNLEGIEEMERSQQGNATAFGLLKIASALRHFPGRKAMIFFSEGIALPPDVQGVFQSVVNAANRSNVSVYSIDVAGLRTESKTAETRREINSRADLRMAQVANTTDPSGPMTKGLERNEDLLRLNPDSGLGQLATQTGGFLITDSNDLKNRIQQVDEDLHSYYMLSYSSNNQKYDGHFRKIEVKLKRSGLSLQSRKGYYAIKGSFGSPVLSYEVAPLAVLNNSPKSDSFPFFAGGFSFPDRQRIGLATIMADLPMSAFTVKVDSKKKTYETDFSVLALIKSQDGEVVAKVSKQYQLTGPSDKAEEAKTGRLLFYRETSLPPGRYTLETICFDAPSGRASVRTGSLEVSDADAEKLRLSDVMMLKRAEPAGAADQNRSNPFQIGDKIVSPNLGEPIQRSLKQVPFFFTAYVPAGSKPKLTIEIRSEGRSLGQMPGELPAADASGRSQFVAGLPVERMPAGSYELKVTITDGAVSLTRSRNFMLVD